MLKPPILKLCEGKMRKKLNTTSQMHIRMLAMLGIFMLPELFSIDEASMPN